MHLIMQFTSILDYLFLFTKVLSLFFRYLSFSESFTIGDQWQLSQVPHSPPFKDFRPEIQTIEFLLLGVTGFLILIWSFLSIGISYSPIIILLWVYIVSTFNCLTSLFGVYLFLFYTKSKSRFKFYFFLSLLLISVGISTS